MKEMQYIHDYSENNSTYNILAFKLQFRFISFFGIRVLCGLQEVWTTQCHDPRYSCLISHIEQSACHVVYYRRG